MYIQHGSLFILFNVFFQLYDISDSHSILTTEPSLQRIFKNNIVNGVRSQFVKNRKEDPKLYLVQCSATKPVNIHLAKEELVRKSF